MSLFGGDGADDVEALEEQVIDTQTKLKKAQWDQMRKEVGTQVYIYQWIYFVKLN